MSNSPIPVAIAAALLVGLLLISGCNLADPMSHEFDGVSCTEGETRSCRCDDGTPSAQVCFDEVFAPCICDESPDRNVCGGSEILIYDGAPITEVGGPCGPCEDGTLECTNEEEVHCADAGPAFSCLPTGSVEFAVTYDTEASGTQLSVFLLQDYSGQCHQAYQLLDNPELQRPLDSIEPEGDSLVLDQVPVGLEYTAVVVLHVDRADTPLSVALGCFEIFLEDEEQQLLIEEVVPLRELPSLLAESYEIWLSTSSSERNFSTKLEPMSGSLNFHHNDHIGQNLLQCLADDLTCTLARGAIGFTLENWGKIRAFTSNDEIKDLNRLKRSINQAAGDTFQTWIWGSFSSALRNRHRSLIVNFDESERLEVGNNLMASLQSLTALVTLSIQQADQWTLEHNIEDHELSIDRLISFQVEDLRWEAGLHVACLDSPLGNSIPPDCEFVSFSAADLGEDIGGEFSARTLGSRSFGFQESTLYWPITALIKRLWESQVQRMEEHLEMDPNTFFSNLFHCEELDDDIRTMAGALGGFRYRQSLRDAVIELCEEYRAHGHDIFAATLAYILLDGEVEYATEPLEMSYDPDPLTTIGRLLEIREAQPYPANPVPFSPLLLGSVRPVSDCESFHYFSQDVDVDLSFCALPGVKIAPE